MYNSFTKNVSALARTLTLAAGALALCFNLASADFDTFLVKKGIIYSQTDAGTPSLQLNNGFVFDGEVDATSSNFVSSVSMLSPTTQVWPIPADSAQMQFQLKKKYSTSTKLSTTFPSGVYSFTIGALHDGTKVLKLSLPGDAFPNSPHLGNWSSFQTIDTGRNLQAVWDPFIGGTVNDFVQFRIEDLQGNKIYKSPSLGKSGALDGTARSFIIPARSLNPNQTYNGILVFERISALDRNSYPGALGSAGYYSETQFPIQTSLASSPTDVQSYSIVKAQRYNQTNENPAVIDPIAGFRFEAKVQPQASNSMTAASVVIPNSQTQTLPVSSDGLTYDLQTDFATKTLLDASFPNGAYSLVLNTAHEGVQTVSLPLTLDRYPSAPHVSNFSATQAVPANQPVLVTWDAWPGGGLNDFVQLRVEDRQGNKLFTTPNFGKNGALDGLSTSGVVPVGIVVPGASYQMTVIFERFMSIDNISLDAAAGTSSYVSRTKFIMLAAPPDAKQYSILKGQLFEQKTTNAASLLSAGNPYFFESTVLSSSSNFINSASLRVPSGAVKPLLSLSDGSGFSFADTSGARSTLDAAYTSGPYVFTIATAHDGTKVPALQLQGDAYPVTPRLLNFQQGQTIDPASDFIVQWDPWTQGTTNDFIQLKVLDLAGNIIFQTKDIGKKSALDGTSASIVIPKNTLVTGVPYQGKLEFRKLITNDTTTYPGAIGLAGYSTRTQFPLGTATAAATVTLSSVQLLANGSLKFQLSAPVGKSYRVDTSTNLISWQPGATNAISASPVDITFLIDKGVKARFYRVELFP